VRCGLLAQRDQLTADLFGEPVAVRLAPSVSPGCARIPARHRKAVTIETGARGPPPAPLMRSTRARIGWRDVGSSRQAAVDTDFTGLICGGGAQHEIDHLLAPRPRVGVRIL
jgi:hypothetical protein